MIVVAEEISFLDEDSARKFGSILSERNKLRDKIQELEAFKKEALEVVEFYGSENHWDGKGESVFTAPDQEDYTEVYYPTHGEPELHLIGVIGGKRAREFLKKHEVKE